MLLMALLLLQQQQQVVGVLATAVLMISCGQMWTAIRR
jgi:hypothetical protein